MSALSKLAQTAGAARTEMSSAARASSKALASAVAGGEGALKMSAQGGGATLASAAAAAKKAAKPLVNGRASVAKLKRHIYGPPKNLANKFDLAGAESYLDNFATGTSRSPTATPASVGRIQKAVVGAAKLGTGSSAIKSMEKLAGGMFIAAQIPAAIVMGPLMGVGGAAAQKAWPSIKDGVFGAGKLGTAAFKGMVNAVNNDPTHYAKKAIWGTAIGAGALGVAKLGAWGGQRIDERNRDRANTMGLGLALDRAHG